VIAKFTCSKCGGVTEVMFDYHDPERNAMVNLRLYNDDGTRRKCDHCGNIFTIYDGKENKDKEK